MREWAQQLSKSKVKQSKRVTLRRHVAYCKEEKIRLFDYPIAPENKQKNFISVNYYLKQETEKKSKTKRQTNNTRGRGRV